MVSKCALFNISKSKYIYIKKSKATMNERLQKLSNVYIAFINSSVENL